MKLYEVPRNTWVRLANSPTCPSGEYFLFHHVDGMYSLCEDKRGNVFHISASTEVEICHAA